MNIQNAEFIKSAVKPADFVMDSMPKVVFSGKSNVGKSSVINRLLNRKNFARVGAAPGKTVHINYFCIDKSIWLVDLPGYGFAKVSKAERERWGKLMEQFFAREGAFTMGVMIVDSRHKPTADDITMGEWFKASGLPFIVVANKCDKLKKSEIEPNMELIRDTLELSDNISIIRFSAETGQGKDELWADINRHI